MKKIVYIVSMIGLLMGFTACEKDNYDAPDAIIQGRILDHNGSQLQTEQGSGNMRIKMEELSWSKGDASVVVTPTYLNVKQDGTYTNNKMFSGEYRMTPVEGAFYPYSTEGEIVKIGGTTTKDFTVTPYLDIEWVSRPSLTADNKITCSFKFKRNAVAGLVMPDLNNARLCVATTQYVGNNNNDSQIAGGTVTVTNGQEGAVITLTSATAVRFTNLTYFVRVGVCCNDNFKKYNYTDIQTVKAN